MKKEVMIVSYAVIFGALVWILDSVVDSLFFYEDTFLNLVLFKMPRAELFFRSEVLICFTGFGIIISYFFSKQRKAQTSLERMYNELEKRVEERTVELSGANKLLTNEINYRVQAEDKLTHNQKMLEAVFNGISDPLVLIGRDMRLRGSGKRTCARYGV